MNDNGPVTGCIAIIGVIALITGIISLNWLLVLIGLAIIAMDQLL